MRKVVLVLMLALVCSPAALAKKKKGGAADGEDNEAKAEKKFAGLKLRSIGPAFMSGRISDIAIHPEDDNLWYVAVGSGGVWKTENAGVTWTPVFDDQSSYSIGCVAIDPQDPGSAMP